MTPGRLPVFAFSVLALVFVLSFFYEFYFEETFLSLLGVEDAAESHREHWRYVLSVTAFSALGLMLPGWALHRALTKRERMVAQIRRLASHDPLTGLPNRTLFSDRLDQAVLRAHREGKRVAVMFLDLDDFKAVNDAWGHGKGDAVLQLMAERLSSCLRATDTVARFGGDEFVVVMPDVSDREAVVALAEKLNLALAEPCPIEGVETSLYASIGIALYPDHGTEPHALLTAADEAMYEAKARGKGRYRFADAGGLAPPFTDRAGRRS